MSGHGLRDTGKEDRGRPFAVRARVMHVLEYLRPGLYPPLAARGGVAALLGGNWRGERFWGPRAR